MSTCALVLACMAVSPDDAALAETWRAYVAHYVSDDGRVIDRGDGDRSTSEGQAYAMVRAVWMNDRATFERVRRWTNANLRDEGKGLPHWLWGQREDGSWGVLDPQPASDADQWMAWALLAGAERWSESSWRDEALVLLDLVWNEETRLVHDERVLLPGPWATTTEPVQLNPSYWLTFAWRDFARADTAHDWGALIAPAYRRLAQCRGASGLPTDWCYVRSADGKVVAAPRGREAHDDFGMEAFRVAWTLAADARWHGEARAKGLLAPFRRLGGRLRHEGSLAGILAPDGRERVDWTYLGAVGAMLPAWSSADADAALTRVLAPARAEHGWGRREDYYTQNWVWLGKALRDAPPWRHP